MTLLFIKITVAKSRKVKPGCNLLESSKERKVLLKKNYLPMMMMMMMTIV
jgi:hypothetical protein